MECPGAPTDGGAPAPAPALAFAECSTPCPAAAVVAVPEEEEEEQTFVLICKHGNDAFPVVYGAGSTVGDVKRSLEALTNVRPDRQKLLGLTKGKILSDEARLGDLGLRQNQKFMMMGTPEDRIPVRIVRPEFSVDEEGYVEDADNDFDISNNPANLLKVQQVIASTEIRLINPPRPGKRLLVLDIDYTIFDCHGSGEISILKRPYLDTFLPLVYKFYDIAFWSQTSWMWVEAKLTEMGILLATDYRVTFILDTTSMPSVEDRHYYQRKKDTSRTEPKSYQIKPLQLIWAKLPGVYTPANTIHVDDLSRNFVMNPRNGLHIAAYKHASKTHRTDRELLFVGYYLMHIKDAPDFRRLAHHDWRDQVQRLANT
jgi:ubiquitin-like domain-containing CTD phosphatase 1